ETVRVKAKPARHRRKSVSDRMSGGLRSSSFDLLATFASAETVPNSSMGCDSPGEDSSIKTGGAMSPVEAARLMSAEFSREGRPGCSPAKKEEGGTVETVRVKAKPARHRRKSVSDRMSGGLRSSSFDLLATFASAETVPNSSMGCDSPGEDSSIKTGGAMSPVEAARVVSAEFLNGTSDAETRGPVVVDGIHSLPSLIDESCGKSLRGSFATNTPETHATVVTESSSFGDESLALEVGRSAESYLEECFVAEVSVMNRDTFNTVPQLSRQDFTITRHLGQGSFSDVFEVLADDTPRSKPQTATRRARNRRASLSSLASSVTAAMLSRPTMAGKNQKKLAMKCLSPQIRSDSEQFTVGAEDLVHETALLASLDHPSIIKLHARASGSLRDSFVLNDGYFILLDRLTGTLTDRLQEWRRVPERLTGFGRDELNIARSIADAVTYLHSKRIVFRDLKPDNVGFDSNGTPKLLNFGFAVGLPKKSADNPTGLLTGRSGTPRYMAPEVGLNSDTLKIGYGRPVDIYSFGVLLWQLCSKQRPYDCIQTADEFESRVYMGEYRPDIEDCWPTPVQTLMKHCWHQRPKSRPAMKVVKAVLNAMEVEPAQQAQAVEEPRVRKDGRRMRRLTVSFIG
ncbi:hypothetical protein THAOC_35025, partial [Thalassiosira oceanica]